MPWDGKKCLVTGGASFIGSHLCQALVARNAAVRVADNLSSGRLAFLDAVKNDLEFLEGDLLNMDFATQACTGMDLVFHLAADHGGRGYITNHPANCARNMALDNLVFGAAVQSGVEKIVFASSACVYPKDLQQDKVLLREEMVSFDKRGGAFADEEYGWAKLMGELSLRAHHRQHGIKAACARISTAYGPRENESHAIIALIARVFIQQNPIEIWGNGEQTRGFTFVSDVVDGLLLAGQHIDDGTAVNVGRSEHTSLNEVAEEIFRAFNWYPPDGVAYLLDKPVGVLHRALDLTIGKERMGWIPQVSLTEGIRRTVDWYTTNRSIKTVTSDLEKLLAKR